MQRARCSLIDKAPGCLECSYPSATVALPVLISHFHHRHILSQRSSISTPSYRVTLSRCLDLRHANPFCRKYATGRTTRLYDVEYYVKSDFRPPKTQAELDKFESSVVEEYVADLRQRCYREQQYKESLLWRARMMNDNGLYRQAQQHATPSCTLLNDFAQRGRA